MNLGEFRNAFGNLSNDHEVSVKVNGKEVKDVQFSRENGVEITTGKNAKKVSEE